MMSMKTWAQLIRFYLREAYVLEAVCIIRLSDILKPAIHHSVIEKLTCVENFEKVKGRVAEVLNVMTCDGIGKYTPRRCDCNRQ